MRDLLFNVPWWLPTILAIVGLVLLTRGNRRQSEGPHRAGITLLLLAVVWTTVSYLVDTPREVCERQTRQFVQSLVDRDWKTFNSLLMPSVDFNFVDSAWRIDGRDTLESAVRADVDQIGLKSASITSIKSAEKDDSVMVDITVWSNQDITLDRPMDSQWEMQWKLDDGRWRLQEIRALRVSGVSAEQVRGNLHQH